MDQNASFYAQSPGAVTLEEIALEWTRELLGLPAGTGGAVVPFQRVCVDEVVRSVCAAPAGLFRFIAASVPTL